jgi:hypothetical protein
MAKNKRLAPLWKIVGYVQSEGLIAALCFALRFVLRFALRFNFFSAFSHNACFLALRISVIRSRIGSSKFGFRRSISGFVNFFFIVFFLSIHREVKRLRLGTIPRDRRCLIHAIQSRFVRLFFFAVSTIIDLQRCRSSSAFAGLFLNFFMVCFSPVYLG